MPESLVESADPITIVAASLLLCAVLAALLRRKVKPVVEAVGRAALAEVRPHLPDRLRRVARRLYERIDPAIARSVLVAAIAAGIAWFAAETLQLAGAVTASITAILSVHLSSHASVREGTKRLVGTAAGVGFAVGVWGVFGPGPLSIAVIAGCGLVVGRLLQLGDGAVIVPATSLGVLVAGSALTESFVWERVVATGLGIVVGMILSPLVSGMTPLERAHCKLAHLSTEISRLLGDLGAGAARGYGRDQATQWLARSRELGETLGEAVDAVEDLDRQARWSLTTPQAEVAPVHHTFRVLEHGVHQVNSVARSMFDAAVTPHSPGVPDDIGPLLTAASEAFAAHATLETEPDADTTQDADNLEDLLDGLREARRQTLHKVRTQTDDTGVLVLTGSIIANIDRMAGSLERSAPALTVGARETGGLGIPAVSEVVPVVRSFWEKAVITRDK
ncbi:aromatic acid exporter family protein [Actinoplanes sp. TRM 88003]|uniref:Aromatic acid exporter family protein n=1 Tax=Paractinoplanes aksuensis TaxID=2939490 RepID=A0ABT1DJP5_9ACTN|nr:aromatic acid exporter family protein [Actinoplanes aksuensis]MCO8271058.1 aromatic acid exporter family protein [Actinoplanes aksuensis]